MRVKGGDTVRVLYGKDKGKEATVVSVDRKKGLVSLDGVNLYKKNVKGDGQTIPSTVMTISKPMPSSKVMLVDPASKKTTRISYKVSAKGKKDRVAVKTGKVVGAKKTATKKAAKSDTKKKTAKTKSSKKTK